MKQNETEPRSVCRARREERGDSRGAAAPGLRPWAAEGGGRGGWGALCHIPIGSFLVGVDSVQSATVETRRVHTSMVWQTVQVLITHPEEMQAFVRGPGLRLPPGSPGGTAPRPRACPRGTGVCGSV